MAKNRHLRKQAHKVYQAALRNGEIERGERCADCGGDNGGRGLDGHHEDYAKPLTVVWLCQSCHKRRHIPKTPKRRGKARPKICAHCEGVIPVRKRRRNRKYCSTACREAAAKARRSDGGDAG